MFEAFPVITAAELKKGDAVMVMGTGTNDASRVMAATLVTGDAEILQRLQRRGAGRPENMSPGLPSGVMGGGTGEIPSGPPLRHHDSSSRLMKSGKSDPLNDTLTEPNSITSLRVSYV